MVFSKFILFSLTVLILFAHAADTKKESKPKKNLKPRSLSPKYDEKTVALDFNATCLGATDPEEMLLSLLNDFPCLSITNIYKNEAFRRHGDTDRVYLSLSLSTGVSCLEVKEISWDEFCILDISYDLLLEMAGVCGAQATNNIYYNVTKKANAWHLDFSEGTIDNTYRYPIIGTDDHKVDIWILDSGVYAQHKEFSSGQVIDEDTSYTYSGPHGTGSAACAGGLNYGTSKRFKIHDYPVCRSTTCAFSNIDIGLNKAISHMKTNGRRSVINMSLGSSGANMLTSTGQYYNNLFQSVIDAGGILVVSAGNDNVDACNYWFSYSDKVISVGSTDSNKARSSFSNYGACVDIYAPGGQIPAAYSTTDVNNVAYISGTSFSSPLVAGMVANILYENNTRTKDQVLQILKQNVYPVSNCPSGYCYGTYYKCLY